MADADIRDVDGLPPDQYPNGVSGDGWHKHLRPSVFPAPHDLDTIECTFDIK
jgi:hypothetical protein